MNNKRIRQQIRRLNELGASDFESAADARKHQADLIKRLEKAGFDAAYRAGIARCRSNRCGLEHCSDACPFGARRRRLREILAVDRLLKKTGGPVHEVWITRRQWERPPGELRTISIPAVKKLNARVLDKLFSSRAVAVGMVKASADCSEQTWTIQVHEIIAGANKIELDRVFANIAYVKQLKTKDVGQAIARVLQRDLDIWEGISRPKAKGRAEFYEWTLNLAIDARVIRYGCDRHFYKLHKRPRIFRPKVRKKRPHPRHLEEHMFGRGKWTDVDPHSMTYKPKTKTTRIVDSRDDDDYYTRDV